MTAEFQSENQRLRLDYEHVVAELHASRKREEELIESLVNSQLRIDRLESIRKANAARIEELSQRAALSPNGDEREGTPESRATRVRHRSQQEKIHQLERTLDHMTAKLGSIDLKANERTTSWKLLDVQRERLAANKALSDCRLEYENLRFQLLEVESEKRAALRDLVLATKELTATRQAHREHTTRLEQRIAKLTNEADLLRHKGAQEAIEQINHFDSEDVLGKQQAIEELRSQVDWLRQVYSVLQETCEAIRYQLEEAKENEKELHRARKQVIDLTRQVAELRASAGGQIGRTSHAEANSTDEQGGKEEARPLSSELRVKIENRRLRRMLGCLKRQLLQADPQLYKSNYHFVTGL